MQGQVNGPHGPLGGIAVSNTIDVVTTDAGGNFSLPDRGKFVWVSIPEDMISKQWWKPADDGDLIFDLSEKIRSRPFPFLHLTDTHLSVDTEAALQSARRKQANYREFATAEELETLLKSLEDTASGVEAVFLTGDLVDLGIEDEFEALTEVLDRVDLEVRVIPGNHDHMAGRGESTVSPNNYLTNTAYPENYERFFGPRWFSFDVPDLHVVALDWLTFELGMDNETQLEWLRQDLEQIPEDKPWALLFHDQPSSTLLDFVPRPPAATFSGHWHTSRIVKVDGTLHINTPSSFFGGLDYSPPMFRFISWDGSDFEIDSMAWRGTNVPDGESSWSKATILSGKSPHNEQFSWQADLEGAGHRQSPVVADGRVYAGSQFEDGVGGFVEAFALANGNRLWHHATNSAVKASPVLAAGNVIVHEVTGDLTALDAKTGELKWNVPSSDPLRRFAWAAPATNGEVIVAGDQSDLRCIDATTGEVIWRRTDISPHHNLLTHSSPLILKNQVFIGFWPTPTDPIGLSLADGRDLWARPAVRSIENDLDEQKRLLVMGTASYDESSDAILMPAYGQTISTDPATGEVRWTSSHEGRYSASTPLPTQKGILATVVGHGLRMLDPATGSLLWEHKVDAHSEYPMQPYSRGHGPVLAQPTVIANKIFLPGLDGRIRILSLGGELLGEVEAGGPIAAPLVASGESILGLNIYGGLFAVELKGLRCL